MRLNLMLLILSVCLSLAASLYFEDRQKSAQPEKISEEITKSEAAPLFSFTDTNGKIRSLSDFKGKVVLINFWATWCVPCVTEFPRLMSIAAKNKDKMSVIALSVDDNPDEVLSFMRRMEKKNGSIPMNFLVAQDQDKKISQDLFMTFRFPETIILDPDMIMRHKIVGGEWDQADLQAQIDRLSKP